MDKPDGAFSTTDIHLAAYLLATEHPVLGLNGAGRHREFVFGPIPKDEVLRFYSGGTCDARKLLGALRDLKGVVFGEGIR